MSRPTYTSATIKYPIGEQNLLDPSLSMEMPPTIGLMASSRSDAAPDQRVLLLDPRWPMGVTSGVCLICIEICSPWDENLIVLR